MPRRILVVTGHPDPDPNRLCRALAEACAKGAESTGHTVGRIDLATIGFPLLRTVEEFRHGTVPESLKDAAEAIVRAEHIAFVFEMVESGSDARRTAWIEKMRKLGQRAIIVCPIPIVAYKKQPAYPALHNPSACAK